MKSTIAQTAPKARARLSGVFEALEGFPAVFGQTFVLGTLVVTGNVAATSHNILTNETLYRFGFLIPLLAVASHIAWGFLFYQLFRVVNRTINSLALLVNLVGCAIQASAAIIYLAPLLILQGNFSGTLSTPERQGLAMVFINLSHGAFNTYLIFFGLWCVLAGYLILGANFMPRIIGAFLILDGIGWMTYLWPPLLQLMLGPVGSCGTIMCVM